jgi:hypothetical protein
LKNEKGRATPEEKSYSFTAARNRQRLKTSSTTHLRTALYSGETLSPSLEVSAFGDDPLRKNANQENERLEPGKLTVTQHTPR